MNLKQINTFQLKLRGLWLQVIVSIAVSFSIMSNGMSFSWIAQKIAEMTNGTSNSTTTTMTLGEASIIGTMQMYLLPLIIPISTISANHLGRKWTIMWGSLCVLCSWVILSLKEEIGYIYAGIVAMALGEITIYAIIPVYIAEMAQANIRGFLCTLPMILTNLGILLGYTCISFMFLNNVAILGAVIVALMFPCFIFAPLSPYFLLMKNKQEQANKSLQKFRNTTDNISEMDDIKTEIERNKNEKSSLKEFFTEKINIKVCLIVLPVTMFQQLSGISTILLFLEVIIHEFNSNISVNLSNIIFGVGKFFACGIALLLTDKLGRRILMIVSCTVTSCALFLLGLYFYLKDVVRTDISSLSWLPLTLLMIYVFGFDFGLGSVPLVLPSEMFPTKFKSYGVMSNQICYYISSFCATKLFAFLKDSYGFYASFWTSTVFTIIGIFFSYFFLHETKGKTLTQILNDLE